MALNEQTKLTPAINLQRRSLNRSRRMPLYVSRSMTVLITFAGSITLWLLIIRLGNYPAFILPTPGEVWAELLRAIGSVSFWNHIGVTLIEVLGGLTIGAVLAIVLGYALAKSTSLNSIVSPLVVASQAVPIVAIAPLLAIWFGYGLTPKIITSLLIVFFPILINVVAGLRSIEPNLHDLMRSLQANRRQMFWKLEVPSALPMILSGFKVGATLSVIGAIVGEFVNSDQGLGFLIKQGNGTYNTARTFVALIALVAMALVLYGSVVVMERRWLAWKK
ncbi:MAG TPA: ABC transporter permease [Anaerolineae bacterium]|nr:ABC transporter permease [Anaerolineae bacterium]